MSFLQLEPSVRPGSLLTLPVHCSGRPTGPATPQQYVGRPTPRLMDGRLARCLQLTTAPARRDLSCHRLRECTSQALFRLSECVLPCSHHSADQSVWTRDEVKWIGFRSFGACSATCDIQSTYEVHQGHAFLPGVRLTVLLFVACFPSFYVLLNCS